MRDVHGEGGVKIRGWEVRCGVADSQYFDHIGVSWVPLVAGITVWVGIARLFMFYFGAWRTA